jgi:hypothetical protein
MMDAPANILVIEAIQNTLCSLMQRPQFHSLDFIPSRPGWRNCECRLELRIYAAAQSE